MNECEVCTRSEYLVELDDTGTYLCKDEECWEAYEKIQDIRIHRMNQVVEQ